MTTDGEVTTVNNSSTVESENNYNYESLLRLSDTDKAKILAPETN